MPGLKNRRPQRFYRKNNEKYGDNYVTWNILLTLGELWIEPIKQTSCTPKYLAKQVGMSYHGMLRLLHRLEKKSVVEHAKDFHGNPGWVITSPGRKFFVVEVTRRLRTAFNRRDKIDDPATDEIYQLVKHAKEVSDEILHMGWKDHQVRDLLWRATINRIDKALRVVHHKWGALENPGGYFRVLVERYRSMDGRVVTYMRKLKPLNAAEGETERYEDYDIAQMMLESNKPFYAFKKTFKAICSREKYWSEPHEGWPPKSWFNNELDKLYETGKIKPFVRKSAVATV